MSKSEAPAEVVKTVYVAGVWRQNGPWEVLGVFDTPEAADAACTEPLHFYGPFELNKRLADETEDWPGCTYPRAGQ
jgi:hypothetical protein